MVSLKKVAASDKTAFSPEHEAVLGLKYGSGKAACLLQARAQSTVEGVRCVGFSSGKIRRSRCFNPEVR